MSSGQPVADAPHRRQGQAGAELLAQLAHVDVDRALVAVPAVAPPAVEELLARVRAILRRTEGTPRSAPPGVLTAGDVEVDLGRREARVGGQAVPLATREFDLLRYLAENAGLALSRQQILDAVWGPGWYGDERTIDVHVGQLRKKLGPDLPLATVWGVGYRLC